MEKSLKTGKHLKKRKREAPGQPFSCSAKGHLVNKQRMWLELTIPAWNALCRQHPCKIDPYMVCVAYLTEAASLSSNLVQLLSIFFCLSKQPRILFILVVTVYASFPSISSFDMSELTQNLYFNDLVALFTYAYFSKPSPITGISLPVLAYPYSVHTCLLHT